MKPSDVPGIEALSQAFADALASNRYDVIADLLSSASSRISAESVEEHVNGLTDGCTIENVFLEIVPSSSSIASESDATVHVCFDLDVESQEICLTLAKDNGFLYIKDVEWGYPD